VWNISRAFDIKQMVKKTVENINGDEKYTIRHL